MSEICHTCPIESNDPDAAILNAAAAEMVNVKQPNSDSWIQAAYNLLESSYDQQDYEAAELMLEAENMPPEKINKARTCAQYILWGGCDFNNLD